MSKERAGPCRQDTYGRLGIKTRALPKPARRKPSAVVVLGPTSRPERHASVKLARSMVARGVAERVTEFSIRLLINRPAFSWQDRQIEAAIRRNYAAGVVFWNGCDPRGQHLPGQMPAYHRPDWGAK